MVHEKEMDNLQKLMNYLGFRLAATLPICSFKVVLYEDLSKCFSNPY